MLQRQELLAEVVAYRELQLQEPLEVQPEPLEVQPEPLGQQGVQVSYPLAEAEVQLPFPLVEVRVLRG